MNVFVAIRTFQNRFHGPYEGFCWSYRNTNVPFSSDKGIQKIFIGGQQHEESQLLLFFISLPCFDCWCFSMLFFDVPQDQKESAEE